MNLIILTKRNLRNIVTTQIKWGNFKYTWYGEDSLSFAIEFCSWMEIAERIKFIYKNECTNTIVTGIKGAIQSINLK